jgi:Cu/Ag efflux pump CusA
MMFCRGFVVIAIKIYGSELEQLRTIGQQVQSAMNGTSGIVDLQLNPQVPVKQVQFNLIAMQQRDMDWSVGELAETIETAQQWSHCFKSWKTANL